MKASSPTKICILRFSALGDVSHVIPLIHVLHCQHPQAQIDWIIDKRYQGLIPNMPGLRLLTFDKKSGWTGLNTLRQQLKGQHYDALLLLQTSARANFISTFIKAKRRIGWDQQRAREGHWIIRNEAIPETPPQHQVQAMLAFGRALGVTLTEPVWPISINSIDQLFAEQCLPGDQPTLMMSPCSSHRQRNWLPERYAAIADEATQLGIRTAIIGAPSTIEKQMADDIQHFAESPLINLVGKDTPIQMLALLNRASIVLAPDSGPLHWANALGKPVIGLYAATWSIRSGPYNNLELCVDRFSEAAEKYRQCDPSELRWGTRIETPDVMRLIDVQTVSKKLLQAITTLNSK